MSDVDYYIVHRPPAGGSIVPDVLREDRNWQNMRIAHAALADQIEQDVAAGTRRVLRTRNDGAASIIERDAGDMPPAGLVLEGPFPVQAMRDRLASDAQWQAVSQ